MASATYTPGVIPKRLSEQHGTCRSSYIQTEIDTFLASGVPASKLGIGIDSNGAVWSGGNGTPTGGVTAPRQSWTTAPAEEYVPYCTLMDTYYQQDRYRWDSVAEVPYLSIDSIGSAGDKFISHDNQTSCRIKVQYLRSRGIGGLIIWERNAGWRTSTSVHDSLMREVTSAVIQTGISPTTISYELPEATFVTLKVYNVLGEEVATLVHEMDSGGRRTVSWNARDRASGVYICTLRAGRFSTTRKLILLR